MGGETDPLRTQWFRVREGRHEIPALRTGSSEAGTGQNVKCMTSKRLRTTSPAALLALALLD